MKKFPRSAHGRRTVTRTVILGSRRGAAAVSESGGGLGDQTIYVASVPGGKADLALSFVGGVAQSLTATGGRSVEPFAYATGPATVFNGGFGWNGAGALGSPYLRRVGEETFEAYALGGISEGALTGGTGWNGAGGLTTPYVRRAGEETFETYDLGGISESALTSGTDWNGGAALFAY